MDAEIVQHDGNQTLMPSHPTLVEPPLVHVSRPSMIHLSFQRGGNIMRKVLAGLAVLFLWPGAAPAVPPLGPETLFTARDLFDLEAADDPQISPDGRWIAYVRRSGDIMTDRFRRSIWLVDTATGRQMPLARDASQPLWSPTGDRLAYIAAADGGRAQLYVRWMQSGEAVPITNLGYAPSSVAWSPDGRQLAYAMFVPDEGQRLGPPQQRPEGAVR